MKLPITFCLFTSTLGHFQRKDIYQQTVDSFDRAFPLRFYSKTIAHIKVSPGEADIAAQMQANLSPRFSTVMNTIGRWSHQDPHGSHQKEYLRDMARVYSSPEIKTPYVLACEDDWHVVTNQRFDDLLSRAVDLLEQNPDIMQVRFPRFANEFERINRLKEKHGLDRSAERLDKTFYVSDDLSMNPSIYRTRDIRAVVLATQSLNVPKHVEHGVREVFARVLTTHPLPFAFFDPELVHICHLGTPIGQSDSLTEPLIAT